MKTGLMLSATVSVVALFASFSALAQNAATPPLTDDFPRRIVPVAARPSLSDPRYRDDPQIFDMFQQVIDPARAQRAFASSAFVARLWPAELIERTLPVFGPQRVLTTNAEGGSGGAQTRFAGE